MRMWIYRTNYLQTVLANKSLECWTADLVADQKKSRSAQLGRFKFLPVIECHAFLQARHSKQFTIS